MSSNGAHHRDRTGAHRDDVDVQCWCGQSIIWMPVADYNAGVVPTCGPRCTTFDALAREPRLSRREPA